MGFGRVSWEGFGTLLGALRNRCFWERFGRLSGVWDGDTVMGYRKDIARISWNPLEGALAAVQSPLGGLAESLRHGGWNVG